MNIRRAVVKNMMERSSAMMDVALGILDAAPAGVGDFLPPLERWTSKMFGTWGRRFISYHDWLKPWLNVHSHHFLENFVYESTFRVVSTSWWFT